MRKKLTSLALIGVLAATGCSSPSLSDGCAQLGGAVDDSVIAVAGVKHDETASASDYRDAAEKVSRLLPELSDASLPEPLEESRVLLVDRMTELVSALSEEDIDWATTLASDMQVEWVSLAGVCSNAK